jgi:hypothetical protein
MSDSIFSDWRTKSYPLTFHGQLIVDTLVGGTPKDPNVAKAWIETKLKGADEDRLRRLVAKTMTELSVTFDEAVQEVNNQKNLSGFKKDPERGLFIEGRHLKAMLKEAVSIAVASRKLDMTKWGATRKWLTNYFPEHVFVMEDRIYLGVMEPSGVLQNFVHTHRTSAIQYQEYVNKAEVTFTVVTDHDFTDDQWAMIWTTAELNGLGAGRSQGHGTFQVVKWDKKVDKAALAKLQKKEAKDTE